MARLLFLTSPELRGADVLRAQQLLRARGVRPGPLDGIYGPATVAGVRAFQKRRALDVDGIVGPATLAELQHDAGGSAPTTLGTVEPPGELALQWMKQREGMTEQPADSNRCAVTKEFGLVGPWCMMAVSLAFKHGAGLVLGDQLEPPWGYWSGRGFAYVPAFEAWAKTRGYWHGRKQPARGDVVCFDWNGDRVADHVGICRDDLGGGVFNSEEGNTSIGNDSNGGELMVRRRYVSQLAGVARITRHMP